MYTNDSYKESLMKLVFSNQPTPLKINSSIFLAGPTPRNASANDWRKEAIKHLKDLNYTGFVFIPCPDFIWNNPNDNEAWDYVAQLDWETTHRNIADKIVFWVPRDIQGGMPAFTTNIEFGEDLNSNKIIYGRPVNAEKCRYLDNRIERLHLPIFTDLKVMLDYTVKKLGDGALRSNGEIFIPLFIWETSHFQSWYQSIKNAGNHIVFAKPLHTHKVKDTLFSFSMAVSVFISSEQRVKDNEILFTRPDISSVVAYYKDGKKTYITLIEEFRTCVNNNVGKVLELPSGSTLNVNVSPGFTAQQEMFEETGLFIQDITRFQLCAAKQLAATFSSYKNHIFKVELTEGEFNILKDFEKNNILHGDEEEEITTVKILEVNELFNSHCDLSTIGAVLLALQKA